MRNTRMSEGLTSIAEPLKELLARTPEPLPDEEAAMKFKNADEFFADMGEHVVTLRFYEGTESITVEELFQHFKARADAELGVAVSALLQKAERESSEIDAQIAGLAKRR